MKKVLLSRYLIVIIISALVLTVIYIIKSVPNVAEENIEPSLQYIVSGCQEEVATRGGEGGEAIKINVEEDSIILQHKLNYVCCANITIDWSKEGNSINITEKNTGEICKCICDYNINAMAGPLQDGSYNINLYGVEFNGTGAELLAQKDITIGKSGECKSNNDCVKVQTTCCSCSMGGEEVCAAKSQAENLTAKNCPAGLMCIAMYNCKIQSCFCNTGKCEAKAE